MQKGKLGIKLVTIVLVMMLFPIFITFSLYRYNMDIVEKDAVQEMFRERYSIYDQVFDHVEVSYDKYLGISYLSSGVRQSLERYNAHLRIIRADGILLYDSWYPTQVRNSLNMEYELKLISEQEDIFSTNGKYIRPINEGRDVVAYAIIVDDPKEIEKSIYENMEAFYIQPYYYGAAATLVAALLMLLIIYREVLKPVKSLRNSSRRIANGQLDFQISCQTNNELGDLCEDFNLMKNSLMVSMQNRLEEKDRNRLYVKSVYDDMLEIESSLDHWLAVPEEISREQMAQLREELHQVIQDLTDYTQGQPTHFRLNNEIMSSYKFIEQLKLNRLANKTTRKTIHLLEPYENSMLYVDRKKMVKVLDNLIQRMDEYTHGEVALFLETGSDLLDYSKMKFKLFWGMSQMMDEFTIDDFIRNIYCEEATPERKNLVDAVLLMREILAESLGDMEVLHGDEVSGFILRIPRYTPDMP